ncbi:hypothetical protein [Priestia megaterium]|nr:hypothetical protein [Priestia megaterium]MDM8151504.1 hypothetical protein [Priestia megaterium]
MIGGQGEDFRGKRNLARKLIAVLQATILENLSSLFVFRLD